MKQVIWRGDSYKRLISFPPEVQDSFGFAVYRSQEGKKHVKAKPLKGFGGAHVLEVVEQFDGNAYRAVYTVKFDNAIYVLHAFQKKSKGGIKTPQSEINLIKMRLREVDQERKRWKKK